MTVSENCENLVKLRSINPPLDIFARGFIVLFAFAPLMGKSVTIVLRCATLHPAETLEIMDDNDGGAIFLPLWRRPSSLPHEEAVVAERAALRSGGIEGSPVRDHKVRTKDTESFQSCSILKRPPRLIQVNLSQALAQVGFSDSFTTCFLHDLN